MSNYTFVRMEVRGESDAVRQFTDIDWQVEALGQGQGFFEDFPYADWQRWDENLTFDNVSGIPTYSWASKRPDPFIATLAEKWSDLTFVVSMSEENDSFIGTVVLQRGEVVSGSGEDPFNKIPEVTSADDDRDAIHREAASILNDLAYSHYVKALSDEGLKPVLRLREQFKDNSNKTVVKDNSNKTVVTVYGPAAELSDIETTDWPRMLEKGWLRLHQKNKWSAVNSLTNSLSIRDCEGGIELSWDRTSNCHELVHKLAKQYRLCVFIARFFDQCSQMMRTDVIRGDSVCFSSDEEDWAWEELILMQKGEYIIEGDKLPSLFGCPFCDDDYIQLPRDGISEEVKETLVSLAREVRRLS